MSLSPASLPKLIGSVIQTIEENSVGLTELDQAIGDGDHVSNLQRGLHGLNAQIEAIAQLDWAEAFQKMGMTIMSTVGGASGSLYGTLFIALSKNLSNQTLTRSTFADAFAKAVEAVKQRGKADKGDKTMLDVLIPVAELLQTANDSPDLLLNLKKTAIASAESTKDMVAGKGRAAFLGERSKGHIDAGAKSSQLIICSIIDSLASPS